MPHTRRRLRNMLLDKRFQLRTTIMFVAACLILAGVFAGLYYKEMRAASRVASTGIPDFDRELAETLEAEDHLNLALTVGALSLVGLLLAAAAIYRTHRIVGPVYVLRQEINALLQGRWPEPRPLRRGDEFTDLADDLNRLISAMRHGNRELVAELTEISELDDLAVMRKRIRNLRERLENAPLPR